MNVWPLLNIFGFGKSIKSPCHWSPTPLTTVRRGWKLRRTRRCKECRDAQTASGECVHLQTCDDAFSCFWKDKTKSERFSYVVNTRYCKYFEDSSCIGTQLTNQNCESCLGQILQQTSSFVSNWICLGMWVRVKHRWTFCTFGLVGTKVDGNLTACNYRIFLTVVRFIHLKGFRKKKKNQAPLRAHDKG